MAAACAFYRLENRFSGDALEKVEAVLLPDSFLFSISLDSISVLKGLMPEPMLFLARICLQLAALLEDCFAVMKIELDSFALFLGSFYPVALPTPCFFELEEPTPDLSRLSTTPKTYYLD